MNTDMKKCVSCADFSNNWLWIIRAITQGTQQAVPILDEVTLSTPESVIHL